MILHGKECKRCNAKDLAVQPDDLVCPLEHLLNRGRPGDAKKRPRKDSTDEQDQEEKLPVLIGGTSSSKNANISRKRQNTSADTGRTLPGSFPTEEKTDHKGKEVALPEVDSDIDDDLSADDGIAGAGSVSLGDSGYDGDKE